MDSEETMTSEYVKKTPVLAPKNTNVSKIPQDKELMKKRMAASIETPTKAKRFKQHFGDDKENVPGDSPESKISNSNKAKLKEGTEKVPKKDKGYLNTQQETLSQDKPDSPKSEDETNLKMEMLLNDTSRPSKLPDLDLDKALKSLSPELKDLILKPKTKKIRRPPNAFMLFAKEQRAKIQTENSEMNNRKISSVLGNTWRNLPSKERLKYYCQAMALEKLHKETYPDYVYSPTEARLRKERKSSRNSSAAQQPLDYSASTTANASFKKKNLQNENTVQPQKKMLRKIEEEKMKIISKEKSGIVSNVNQMSSPVCDPRIMRYWPTYDNITPPNNNVHHPQQFPKNEGNVTYKNLDQSAEKGNQDTKTTKTDFIPTPYPNNKMLPPNNMHPAVFNPWLMWPGFYNSPIPSKPFFNSYGCSPLFPPMCYPCHSPQHLAPRHLFQNKDLPQTTDCATSAVSSTNQTTAINDNQTANASASKEKETEINDQQPDSEDEFNSLIIVDENSDEDIYTLKPKEQYYAKNK